MPTKALYREAAENKLDTRAKNIREIVTRDAVFATSTPAFRNIQRAVVRTIFASTSGVVYGMAEFSLHPH